MKNKKTLIFYYEGKEIDILEYAEKMRNPSNRGIFGVKVVERKKSK